MPLNAEPGSPDANSYLTVEEADEYFASRLHAGAWNALSAEEKEAALIWATSLIDARVCFVGRSTFEDQALRWPIETETGHVTRNGFPIPEDEIPRDLKRATAELALSLLPSDTTVESDISVLGLTQIKAGPIELRFSDGGAPTRNVPDHVKRMLVPSWLCDEEEEGKEEIQFVAL